MTLRTTNSTNNLYSEQLTWFYYHRL